MSESIYAALGKKTEQFDNLALEYDRLLTVLAQVQRGEITTDRISVDLQARSWAVAPVDAVAEEVPAEAAAAE